MLRGRPGSEREVASFAGHNILAFMASAGWLPLGVYVYPLWAYRQAASEGHSRGQIHREYTEYIPDVHSNITTPSLALQTKLNMFLG